MLILLMFLGCMKEIENTFVYKGKGDLTKAFMSGDIDKFIKLLKEGEDINESILNEATILHIASFRGDKRIVELLIDNGANIDLEMNDGSTPLYIASCNGHKEVVELLLENGASVDLRNKKGATPLHIASAKGQKEVVALLLDKGVATNVVAEDESTPLYMASQNGHKEVVELLLSKGANIDLAINDGRTPLYIASQQGHKEIVELLLSKLAGRDSIEKDITNVLLIAVQEGHKEVVAFLLEKGASISKVSNDGRTPLHIASLLGHREIVELLLSNRALIDLGDKDGATSLCMASYHGRKEVVELLIKQGANLDLAINDGRTPLYTASYQGHKEIVELLLKRGAKIDLADEHGVTPLYIASQEGREEVVALLLDSGAEIDLADKDGATPLLIASWEGNKGVVELLLTKGAAISKVANDGRTPLYIASQNGHKEVVELLLKKGAEIDLADMDGETPLFISSQNGHKEVVELLLKRGASIDLADKYGRTPLYTSTHKEIMQILLKKWSLINLGNDSGTFESQLLEFHKSREFLKVVAKNMARRDLTQESINRYKEAFDISKHTKILDVYTYFPEIAKVLIEFHDVFGLEPNKIIKDRKGKKKTELDAILNRVNNSKPEELRGLKEIYELAREFGFKTAEQVNKERKQVSEEQSVRVIKKAIQAEQEERKRALENIEAAKAKHPIKNLNEETIASKENEDKYLADNNKTVDYSLLSEVEIVEILSNSSNREEVLDIISDVKFRGKVFNRNENIMQILVRSGFKIDFDLFILTVKNDQLRLMKSIMNKVTIEEIEQIKGALSSISLNVIPVASEEMILALGTLGEVFIKALEEKDRRYEEDIEKGSEEKDNIKNKQDLEERRGRVFVYKAELKGLEEALEVKKLERNLRQYLNGDNSNLEKLANLENIWELKGHGSIISNMRIYFTTIRGDVIVLLTKYKKQDKITKEDSDLLRRRARRVIREGYLNLIEFKMDVDENLEDRESPDEEEKDAEGNQMYASGSY